MSGILFQINHDSSPIEKKIFEKMFSRIEHRGGDSSNSVYLENAALGCQNFWTTPEEVNEIQPIISTDKCKYLLLDGRIDNREELVNELGLRVERSKLLSDGHLILSAYERWGEKSFEKLVGSFAFILYSPKIKSAFAVRDQAGDRTLFFYSDSKMLIIASEPFSILANENIPMQLNKSKVAEYLAVKHPNDNSTYFKNIYEILPAHFVSLADKKVKSCIYWKFNLSERIRYKSDHEYTQHFLEIMDKSITSKMRSIKTPGVMMSGGLDSTTIAAIAANYSQKKLRTFTYVFNKHKECDESKYVDSFCKKYDVESIRINGDECLPLFDINSTCASPNFPNQDPYQVLKNKLYHKVKETGTNTLLTGWYADQLFAGSEFWLKDSLKDLMFLSALKTLNSLVGKSGWLGMRNNSAVRVALRPFRHLKNFIFGVPVFNDNFNYLTPFSKSLLNNSCAWNKEIANGERTGQILNVLGLRTAFDASACSHCMSAVNIDFRYPFRDLRLIDFFLKIPAYQLFDSTGYKNKYILRTAMKGILPGDILNRNSITAFIPLLDSTYGSLKKSMDTIIERNKDDLCEYIEINILNAILNEEFKNLNDIEYNIYWNSFTFLEWKSRVFSYENGKN